MAWPKLFAESKKVEQLTTEVDLLRTYVTSLTNLITKAVIPNVLTAVDALDGVVAATDATVEGLQSATAIDQSLQGATGGSSEIGGVVTATDATVEGSQSVTAIDQSLQGATGGSSGTSPATSTKE